LEAVILAVTAPPGARKRALLWTAGFALAFVVPAMVFELPGGWNHPYLFLLLMLPLFFVGQWLQMKGGPKGRREYIASQRRKRRIHIGYSTASGLLTLCSVFLFARTGKDVMLLGIAFFGFCTWYCMKLADEYRD
jgi:hypothetical protein